MSYKSLFCGGELIGALGDVSVLSKRGMAPSELKFHSKSKVSVGDETALYVGDTAVFRGRVFTVTYDGGAYKCLAYDLLRYFENEDTKAYDGKTAGEMLRLICLYNKFPIGDIADTKMRIPSALYDMRSFFSVMESALTITASAGFGEFVLFDDCGRISLLPAEDIAEGVTVSSILCRDLTVTESIDEDFCTSVRLISPKVGGREFHTFKNEEAERKYGSIVLCDTLTESEIGNIVGKKMIETFSSPKITVKCTAVYDVPKVRGGAIALFSFDGGVRRMICESAERIYRNGGAETRLVLTSA